jgi:hypothetical protein
MCSRLTRRAGEPGESHAVFAVSDDDLTASLTFIEVTAVAGWLAVDDVRR